MPKRQTQRIIDSRTSNRSTNISGVTLTSPGITVTAGDGLTLTGTTLDVGAGDGISVAADAVAVDSTVVRTTRTVTAGSGLTGGGALSSDLTLSVGAGTLITVGADTVGITTGANYQYIGTGSGTAAAWQNLSGLAGAGLTHSAGVLAIGAGSGITVNADDVALTTPGTLTATTSNTATGNHTHAITTGAASTLTVATSNATGSSASLARADHLHTITTSSNPGAAASILASSSAGLLQLVQVASNATFASGFAGSGYRVDYGVTEASKASAEFDNLTVRGRMRVYELLIQQIRATNGSVFVTSTGKAKAVTASSNPTWTVNGSQLTLNGSNATLATALYTITTSDSTEDASDKSLYHGFLTGDLIRAQQTEWNGSAFAGVYQSDLEVTGVTDLYTFTGARVSSGTSAAAVGYDYARLGSATDTTRQGTIYLTSDDSNAPFIDILDGVQAHSGWNASGNVKVRLGKLSGITDAYFGTLSGYGLYSDNVYLRGSIYATSGVFSGTVYATDGIFSGTVYASAGTFTGTVTASAGAIGGWNIGATALTAGSGANTVGVDSGGTNPAIYAGSATPGSAPFRVTKAGALYAEGADVRGAITASSGSITGFLTLGSSGGIYQGTGTAGTPATGLKIWNDGGVGRIGGYNGGTLEWYASTTGRIYSGRGSMRLGYDDIRLKHEDSFTDLRSIKWVEDIDFSGDITDLASTNGAYAYIGAYTYSSGTSSELYISNRVNNTGTPAQTQHSTITLVPSRKEGSTNYSGSLMLACFNSTYSYESAALFTDMYLNVGAISSTPTRGLTSSSDAQIYVKGGYLVFRYNDGGTYRYKYLNLAGTGTSWTHSTTAP
jgi:hypothetical protein